MTKGGSFLNKTQFKNKDEPFVKNVEIPRTNSVFIKAIVVPAAKTAALQIT